MSTGAELSPDFADIIVSCPVPGQSHESMRLGDFLDTEVKDGILGSDILGSSIENAQQLIEQGVLDKDTAIRVALGSAAVIGEDGEVMRAPASAEPTPHFPPPEAEKK